MAEETNAQKRKKIVDEILSTEQYYVECLSIIVKGYQKPLLLLAGTDGMPAVSKNDVNRIFSNIHSILPINQTLLEDIQERIENNWTETTCIGDIFLRMAPTFKMYQQYGNNYENAIEMLTQCMEDVNFADIVDRVSSEIKSIKLESLLIMPIQRIPRYNLLIRDLLAKTNESHPDHQTLKDALSSFESVMEYLDSAITTAENAKKLGKMAKFRGADKLLEAHRVLKMEGEVDLKVSSTSKFSRASEERLKLWVFNDVIVSLQKSKAKSNADVASTENTWPLVLVWVKDMSQDQGDPKFPFLFSMIGPMKTYTLKFSTEAEKRKWLTVIREAIDDQLTEDNAPNPETRFGEYTFPSRDGMKDGMYVGWWEFGRIHGYGTRTYYDNVYEGDWVYNTKEGQGRMQLISGEVYNGEWREDLPRTSRPGRDCEMIDLEDGQGSFQYTNGDSFNGDWVHGVREGMGLYRYVNGDRYHGLWHNNVPHGAGTYTTKNGFEYRGQWENGKPHGGGRLVAPNGRTYIGDFDMGLRSGYGRMDFLGGEEYIGQWLNNKRHGYGIQYSETDGTYRGYWVGDLMEGYGKLEYANGDVYEGMWKNNQPCGRGQLTPVSGEIVKYEGLWDGGRISGKGVFTYENGGRYDGSVKGDKAEGSGVYVSQSSVQLKGTWVAGNAEGKCSLTMGKTKYSSTVQCSMMGKNEESFIVPAMPVSFIIEL